MLTGNDLRLGVSAARVLETAEAVRIAQSRFDAAEGSYIDAAALELTAAKLRLSAAILEARSLFCPEGLDGVANGGRTR